MKKGADVRKELQSMADPDKAAILQRFFKTGPGEYGEGDVFIGVMVPQSRQVAKKFSQLPLGEVRKLLYSRIHEEQLVDLSAPNILGAHLVDRGNRQRRLLYRLTKSENVWERRIAILATYHFIRNGYFSDTLKIAEMLLQDRHDLMHKAAGWMLREVGKRDAAAEEAFLEKHCNVMPRMMLRYAIERLPENKRRRYKKKGRSIGGRW